MRGGQRPRPNRLLRLPSAFVVSTVFAASVLLLAANAGIGSTGSAFDRMRSRTVGHARIPLARLIGQHLMGRMTGTTPSSSLLTRIRRGELGGVILFADNFTSVRQLRRTVAALRAAAHDGGQPPLLIATDQEGGIVKRLPAGPPYESAAQMGADGSPTKSWREGNETAAYLRAAGINVDLAPVLDVPAASSSFLGSRAFARDPAVVARVGVAFASGVQLGRVAATAKHFPGLGRAAGNTDLGDVTILNRRADLLRDLAPFRAAAQSGIQLVMVSNARYPALDPSRRPAVLSQPIVTGLLRRRLGFRGVAITDTLAAPSVRQYTNVPIRAIRAGMDILLYSDHERDSAYAYAQLLHAARTRSLHRETLESSFERIMTLKAWLSKSR